MDQDAWIDLNLRGMQAAFRSFAGSSGARILELDGVMASVNAALPERSVFNSVVYRDPDALAAARDEVAGAYADAGCSWTVWAHERDTAAARMLAEAGHTLDAQPRAMGRKLDGVEQPDLAQLDWSDQGDPEEVAALNDAAYGYRAGSWIRRMGRDPEGFLFYVTRVDGRPAASVCSRDEGEDCTIWNVATAEWARGRGLCTALMRRALADAESRGCPTSTLQATKLGAPIYRHCGYEDFGSFGMWEYRPPEQAAQAHPAPAA